jgi:hypothetical protein
VPRGLSLETNGDCAEFGIRPCTQAISTTFRENVGALLSR